MFGSREASSYNTHDYKTEWMEHKAVCNVELEGIYPPAPHAHMIGHSINHNKALYLALPSADW